MYLNSPCGNLFWDVKGNWTLFENELFQYTHFHNTANLGHFVNFGMALVFFNISMIAQCDHHSADGILMQIAIKVYYIRLQ